jgi:hypothetical protein
MDDHHFSYITKLMGKIKNKKAPAMVDEWKNSPLTYFHSLLFQWIFFKKNQEKEACGSVHTSH